MEPNATYAGEELELFRKATRWKNYFARRIRPFIHGDVLEVGAGMGATTNTLLANGARHQSWTCLEPDAKLGAKIMAPVSVLTGNIRSLPPERTFDTILYVDVLEHIADDQLEIQSVSDRLRTGGRLIVLAPAHQRLFSEFDSALGHHRRYDRKSLRSLLRGPLREEASFYLDSAGLLASSVNSFLLHRSLPNAAEIWFWDKFLVPASIILDKLVAYRLGKSVVIIAKKV